MMNVWVVEMLRWGNREKHSYIKGVYSEREWAKQAAHEEEVSRGGKYVAKIQKFKIGIRMEEK